MTAKQNLLGYMSFDPIDKREGKIQTDPLTSIIGSEIMSMPAKE